MKVLRELGSFERALLLTNRYAPFHIVSILQLDGAPAVENLRAALGLLQKRHPLLAARITEIRGRYYFESIPDQHVHLAVLQRQGDEHWTALAESELSRRIDSQTEPLFRCTYLFDAEGGRAEIVLTISHSIVDATALMHLWHELLVYGQQLQAGRMPAVSTLALPPAADSLFPPAFRGAALAWRTVPFMSAQFADELQYRWQTRGRAILPLRKPSPGHILSMRWPRLLSEGIARRARVEHLTLNSLLNAAMLLAVNRHLYGGQALPMRTMTFASLRPYVIPAVENTVLSPYISMLRYSVMVNPARGLRSIARDLHAQIAASFKRGHKFVAAATSERFMQAITRLKAFRMTNTALNYNGPIILANTYGPISLIGLHGVVSPFDLGPEYAAQVSLMNDELCWDLTYVEADMDRALAQRIADEIRASLEGFVAADATVNPSEFD